MALWFDICQDRKVAVVETEPKVREAICCGLATSPVTAADAQRLAPMFKALGDPVRLQMVSMIAAKPELCVCEITPAFDLSSGTISHHLKTLREAGLVDCERRGTYVYYWVQPQALVALAGLLSQT
jgi:ArsR family transcriptional regulator, arsenate/arsenite/antimonite-responsive transcriptional repressor